MIVLNRKDRRLLVELAFCALNHGLVKEADSIRIVLTALIADEHVRRRCNILLLIGLHRLEEAKKLLEQCAPQDINEFAPFFLNDAQ